MPASLDDINSTQQGGVRLLSAINSTLLQIFPRVNGSFTLAAATVTNVAQVSIAANGIVVFTPTNSAAALAVRTNGLFVSIVTSGVGFQVSTQVNSAAAGGTFSYIVLNAV